MKNFVANRKTQRDDEGALLILALIFILLMAIVVTAVLTETTQTFTSAQVVRQYVTKNYAADAGLRYGVQQVRANTEICNGPTNLINPPANFLTSDGNTAPNNQPFPSVSVSCTVDSDQQQLGANGYAIITHDPSNANGFDTGNHNLSVHGPVFMGSDPNSVSLDITKGNAYTLGNSPCPAEPSGLTLDPGYIWSCQPTIPDAPTPTLPTNSFLTSSATMPTRTGAVTNPAGNCAVFAPGKYSNMNLTLNQGNGNNLGQNYFASGVYYLDNVTIDITKAVVFAGQPHTGATYLGNVFNETSALTAFSNAFSPCSNDAAAKAALPAGDTTVNGTGVKFILGGNSSIVVDNPKGYLEMYSRFVPYSGNGDNSAAKAQAATEGTQGISVMSVPVGTGAPWDDKPLNYATTCLGQGQANGGGGSNLGIAVHGQVYTPQCQLQIRDNLDVAQFTGGLDIGRLSISSSANVSNFLISVESVAVPQALTITSVATGGDVNGRSITGKAHVQVDNTNQSVTITSWRVD